jgi:hypothetical protein
MLSSLSPRPTRPLAAASWCAGRAWLVLPLAIILFMVSMDADAKSKAKPSRAPRPEPDLKILELTVSPNPYTASDGLLTFSAVVQLPKEVDGATLLEVSSLVASPSKTSIRFLTTRKPLEEHPLPVPGSGEFPRLSVVLTWDGMNHNKTAALAGRYQYEVRAKLLANGEKGPRTLMVSWPKRGTIDVK